MNWDNTSKKFEKKARQERKRSPLPNFTTLHFKTEGEPILKKKKKEKKLPPSLLPRSDVVVVQGPNAEHRRNTASFLHRLGGVTVLNSSARPTAGGAYYTTREQGPPTAVDGGERNGGAGDWGRQDDWAYSFPIVALDVAWNAAFVATAVTALFITRSHSPHLPLRLWIAGYAVQCVVHVVCVSVEYRRRRYGQQSRSPPPPPKRVQLTGGSLRMLRMVFSN